MDKPNLYYIVIEGTNGRAFDEAKCPIIFLPEFVDDFLGKANNTFAKNKFVKISVEEYERTFTEMIEY
jgi:hypothetical protein